MRGERKTTMRKMLIALMCAAAMMLALPAMAFAVDSPSNGDQTAPSSGASSGSYEYKDVTYWGKAGSPDADGIQTYYIAGIADHKVSYGQIKVDSDITIDKVEVTSEKAGNFVEGDYLNVASFIIESKDFDINGDKITLAWEAMGDTYDPTRTSYEGLKCLIFIEHADGTFDQGEAGVTDGYVTVIMDKLSTITFALTNEKFEGEPGPVEILSKKGVDDSSVSPKTGGIL